MRLELDDTRVTDAGIRRLQHLTKLRRLHLDGVGITDEGLAWLTSFKELESLSLLDTRIDGTGLDRLQPLDRLRCVGIEGPLVTVEGLGHLTSLTKLGLWKTRLTDRGLEFLKGLPDLEELILDDETVTYQGLAVLQALPRLKNLIPGGIRGSDLDLDQFRRANPSIDIFVTFCGTPRVSREAELESRRLCRQGLTGRLRLAWRSLVGRMW